jgi:glycosyltransferase involved in cell wall biosynthesis
MRFLFLASPTSIHTRRWVDGLRARGHDVVVIPNNEGRLRGIRKLGRWIWLSLQVRWQAGRPDTLLVVHWIPSGVRALALMGLHPRVGVAWGSDIYLTGAETWRRAVRARLQSAFLRGCDLVIGTSDALARAAVDAGAPPASTRCLRFGVDVDRFRPGPDPVGLRAWLGLDGFRVVLSNRTIAPLYHQGTVVEALARLPSDAVLVMTRHASDPVEVARIVGLAKELGVSERVRIVPEVADRDMADLYRLAEVVVSVPATDGGASTIIEALACGRQVVASDLASVREWMGDIDPGALVPVGDVAATAQAIEQALARSASDREELAYRSRAAVEDMGDERRALLGMERIHVELVRRRTESGDDR